MISTTPLGATRAGSPPPGAPMGLQANRTERLVRLKSRLAKPGEASFFFWDAHFRSEAVKVLPGEYFVFDEDVLIMTTLGTCIAV